MIKSYNPVILSISIIHNFLNIHLNNKKHIYYYELLEYKNAENLLNIINNFLIEKKYSIKNISTIVICFNLKSYTTSKIISTTIQGIGIIYKIPIIKLKESFILSKIQLFSKKLYTIIFKKIDSQNIFLEIYNKNKLLLNKIQNINYNFFFKKNITKFIKVNQNNFLLPLINIKLSKKEITSKPILLPYNLIPDNINKNFYFYYNK